MKINKNPRAAVWLVYLNLVTKGASCEQLQASKFPLPREKLAHRRPTPDTRQIERWLK